MQWALRRVFALVGLILLARTPLTATQAEPSAEAPDMEPDPEADLQDLEEMETDKVLSGTGRLATFSVPPNFPVLQFIQAWARDGEFPDVIVSVSVLLPSSNVDVYCKSGSPESLSVDVPPGPTSFTWKSDHRHGEDYVFISKYHPSYDRYVRQTSNGTDVAQFLCTVLQTGDTEAIVTLGWDFDFTSRDLVDEELVLMEEIFDECCQGEERCKRWKTHMEQDNARAADICHFHGTVCNDRGNLLRLNFNGMHMNCPFPGEIFTELKYLEKLHLKGNPMTGQMPDVMRQLQRMQRLEHFEISDALFEGNLTEDLTDSEAPACQIARNGTMAHLDLENCTITGTLPACLFDQDSRLHEINFYGNRLTGELPKPSLLASSLLNILLDENQLTGEIPPEWTTFSNLQILDLSLNQLTGEIPYGFGRIESLRVLKLDSNQLSGALPVDIPGSSSLIAVNISSNLLSGELPDRFTSSSSLIELYLHNNSLSGAIPKSLGNALSLTGLDLGHNRFSGTIPEELGNLTDLVYVFMDHNRLSGPLPTSFSRLINLVGLVMTSNRLSGSIPEEWGAMERLRILDLAQNRLTGVVPGWMQDMFLVNNYPLLVYLDDNRLTGFSEIWYTNGSIPGRLVQFSAARNRIKGEFPRRMAKQRSLRSLSLAENEMTGPLPAEESDLYRVLGLNLSRNAFTGEIPETWEDLFIFTQDITTVLDLSYNMLAGEIPSFFSKKPNSDTERRIYLAGNNFTYECPVEATLEHIKGLDCETEEASQTPTGAPSETESAVSDRDLSVSTLGRRASAESTTNQVNVRAESDSSPGILVPILATAAATVFAVAFILLAMLVRSRKRPPPDAVQPDISMTPISHQAPPQDDRAHMLTGMDSSNRL